MNYPIEINGKTYEFAVNRNALKKLNVSRMEELSTGESIEMIENMFYAFITVKQPNISYEEAMALLDVAEEEYGLEEISKALTQLVEMGFTMKGKSKIAWIKNK